MEVRKGCIIRLVPWMQLQVCLGSVGETAAQEMRHMCEGEVEVLAKAPRSGGGAEMILVAGATEGARLRLPLSAVACVVRSPASAPTGEEVLKTCWLDLECDWLEGAACEYEDSLPEHLLELPIEETAAHLAGLCDEYDAAGFFYQQHASGKRVAGFFMRAAQLKGVRMRVAAVRGCLCLRRSHVERFKVGQPVKVRGKYQTLPAYYDAVISAELDHSQLKSSPHYVLTYAAGTPPNAPEEGTHVPATARAELILFATATESSALVLPPTAATARAALAPAAAEWAKLRYAEGQRVLACLAEDDDGWGDPDRPAMSALSPSAGAPAATGGPWFAGVVHRINRPSPAFSICFDDGKRVHAVYAKHIIPAPTAAESPSGNSSGSSTQGGWGGGFGGKAMGADADGDGSSFAVGQRVLANRDGLGTWLDATVQSMSGGSGGGGGGGSGGGGGEVSLALVYDADLHREEGVPLARTVAVVQSYEVGQRISCLFEGGAGDGSDLERWESGVVTARHVPADSPSSGAAEETGGGEPSARTYSVLYDGGDVEEDVNPSMVRAEAMGNPVDAFYTGGDRVLARPDAQVPEWRLGTVERSTETSGLSYDIELEGIGPHATVFPGCLVPMPE